MIMLVKQNCALRNVLTKSTRLKSLTSLTLSLKTLIRVFLNINRHITAVKIHTVKNSTVSSFLFFFPGPITILGYFSAEISVLRSE